MEGREDEELMDQEDEEEEWSKPVDDCRMGPSSLQNARRDSCATPSQASAPTELDHPKTILHIDVDCFYAQVEMIHNPELRDVPLGIQQKYLLVTCNYPARARGVTKLMGITEAKKKCPELVLVSGEDLTSYREMSYQISEFLMKYTPHVERLGFDENYLDLSEMVEQRVHGGTAQADVVGHVYSPTDSSSESEPHTLKPCSCGCHHRLAVGSQIAADIRSALSIELGITCCAGIAHNKLLAKMGGSQHKPNQQTTVFPCHALSLISSLNSAHCIPGVGWATSKRLKELGVVSVSDLQQFPCSRLEEELGVALATTIHQLSFGVDHSSVVTYSRPQTLSIEDSFRCCSSEADAESKIKQLLVKLLPRVQEDGRTPHSLRLTVRKANKENRYLHRESRQCSLPTGIATKINTGQLDFAKDRLVTMAMSLFRKMVDTKQPFHLTLINVAFAKLEELANNNITSFFNTPGSFSSSSQCHIRSSDDASRQASPSPSQEMRGSAKPSKELEFSTLKRKHPNRLTNFFMKKQVSGDGSFDTTGPRTGKPSRIKGGNRETGMNVTLPSNVDPTVFADLPAEIQQEVLLTYSQQKPDSRPWSEPATPAVSLHTYRNNSNAQLGGEISPEANFCASQKKPIFSPTKSKERSSTTVPDRSQGGRNPAEEMCSDVTCVMPSGEPETNISEKHGLDPKDKSFTAKADDPESHPLLSEPLNGETSCSPKEGIPGLCSESQQKLTNNPSLDSPQVSREITTENFQHNKPSAASCFSRTKVPVPKGVAPDVFSALPPEIQREVAAEMAMQKHSVTSGAGSSGEHQRNTPAKSPSKKVNSMLNYLKRR